MKRVGVFVFLGLLAVCLPAHAVTFQLDSMTVDSSDPGLVVEGGLNYSPATFDLNCPDGDCEYDHVLFEDLFYLKTNEDWVNPDDQVWTPFTLTFNFSLPSAGGQDVIGEVKGYFGYFWQVKFDNAYVFEFNDGANEYELLAFVNPEEVDGHLLCQGYNFDMKFKLKECEAVPIPAALWLLGSGLVGLLGSRRLRNRV